MFIEVKRQGESELMFEGNADDFLEQNDYDEELSEFLTEMDYECDFDESRIFLGNFFEEIKITKKSVNIWD